MGKNERSYGNMGWDLLMMTAFPVLVFFLSRQVLSNLDPQNNEKAEAKKKARAATERLQSIFAGPSREEDDFDDEDYEDDDEQGPPGSRRRPRQEELNLTSYEQTIAMEVVSPSDIPVTFDDIGGLGTIVEELRESIIYPLTMPHLYSNNSDLLTAPSGVLLYGPPGCGKTMLAKALARESGACFINVHISTLTEKWYGDSNKLVAAVFSLARKLQPTIVFIDEIDAVLGQRRSGEHEASGMVKAEFMTQWDGLASATTKGGSQRICVLGATNRIQDIDEAILRRMPKKFPVSLPNASQRRQIFELTLRDTKIDHATDRGGHPAFDLDALVRVSAGMSGSDIKEACRDAAMVPVRESIKAARDSGKNMRSGLGKNAVRGLQTDDFFGRRAQSKEPVRIEESEDDGHESHGSGSTEEVDNFDDVDEVISTRRT